MKLNRKPRNRPTHVGSNYLFVRGTKVSKKRGDYLFNIWYWKVGFPYAKIETSIHISH